jgi:hypothetical protein
MWDTKISDRECVCVRERAREWWRGSSSLFHLVRVHMHGRGRWALSYPLSQALSLSRTNEHSLSRTNEHTLSSPSGNRRQTLIDCIQSAWSVCASTLSYFFLFFFTGGRHWSTVSRARDPCAHQRWAFFRGSSQPPPARHVGVALALGAPLRHSLVLFFFGGLSGWTCTGTLEASTSDTGACFWYI